MSHRREQLASSVERAVQEILARGLNDPRVRGMITVTKVEITEDRRNAKLSVSILPEDQQELTMHGLRAATPHIRKRAMSRVRSRYFPAFEFVLDESIKRQSEVLSLIAKASAERLDRETPDADDGPANDATEAGDLPAGSEGDR